MCTSELSPNLWQCSLEMQLPGFGFRTLHFKSGVTTHVTLYHYTVNLSFRLHSPKIEWSVGNRIIVFIFSLITFIYCIYMCT